MNAPDAPSGFYHLHMVSDSTGETLTTIGKAAAVQYPQSKAIEHIYPLIRTKRQLDRVLSEIRSTRGIVIYTIVNRELSEKLGLPLGTLKSRLRRGLAALKDCLGP